MKNLILTYLFLFSITVLTTAQNVEDTKDFIAEKIVANPMTPDYTYYVFFEMLKVDANTVAGKTLSEDELNHMFIFVREASGPLSFSVAQLIDFRGVTKISTTKTKGKIDFFTITLYLSGKYFSTEYKRFSREETEHNHLLKMEIYLSDNKEVVNSIKNAILHLGKLYGINIKDGDLF